VGPEVRDTAGGERNPGASKPLDVNGRRDLTRITATGRIGGKILAGTEGVLTDHLDADGEDLSRHTADDSGTAQGLVIEFDESDSKSQYLRHQEHADQREHLQGRHGRWCAVLLNA
jgi:hypothetical protein